MINDYRNTKYCPTLTKLKEKKQAVVDAIKAEHQRAEDMHAFISKNDSEYKDLFMEAYNYKCAYCGASIELIPKRSFEIDHFLYEKSPRFNNKKDAGHIDNLVLACPDCNRNKSSLDVADESYDSLYPDGEEIKNIFYRDKKYYIKISETAQKNSEIELFYEKLKLGSEINRLNFLLMNLMGFQQKHEENAELYREIGKIITIIRCKRNMI